MNIKQRNFANGRIASFGIYVMYCIFLVVVSILRNDTPIWAVVSMAVAMMLSVIALIVAMPGRRMAMKAYIYMQSTFLTLVAVLTSLIFRDVSYLLYMFFVQSIVMFLFMESGIYHFQLLMNGIALVALFVIGNVIKMLGMVQLEHVFGFVALILVQWIIMTIINGNKDQTRHMQEQERGLDDMTRVLEAKCYESRKAVRSKSEFLSNMSHEIRTPINSVLGMNEMIMRESSEEHIREYAKDIQGSGRVLLAIINDILDYSKIETGNLVITPRTYRLEELIDDLVKVLNVRLEEKELKFQCSINPEIPKSMYGDDMRLRQVLTNLLGNAIESSEENSISLRVSGEPREGDNYGLHCEIVSFGSRIKVADVERLYRGFEKYEQGLLDDCYGPELGITITAQILRCMGCELVIKVDEDRGAVFSFTVNQEIVNPLPLGEKKMELEQVPKEAKVKKELYAPSAKVLVVDDNEMNRKVFSFLMKKPNIYVDQAESGRMCLDLVKERHYDIIFMDHMMPEMDGIETFHLLRAELNLCNMVPVVALTANAVSGAEEMYLKEGFDAFLAKPVMPGELEKVLYRFLPEEKIEEKK